MAAVTASGPANAACADGPGSHWYASAPYLTPEDNSLPDAAAAMDATGQQAFHRSSSCASRPAATRRRSPATSGRTSHSRREADSGGRRSARPGSGSGGGGG
ncbi:hypothetical protein CG736_33565 [Kitasatospora sp. CB02891]|nr:hypothetical protein CG736_33565 [Kitasatospora sp. CB02891]